MQTIHPVVPPPAPRVAGSLTVPQLAALARRIRIDVVKITFYSGTGSSHVGGELSIAEILAVLYGNVLRVDPKDPAWPGRDRLILSKGHAAAALYAALAWRGFFPRERLLDQFNRVGGFLVEHASMQCPGVEVPTGSLGMGLSNGAGMAWGAKYLARRGSAPFHTFAILSDGECLEGQTWEAAMAAGNYGLDNLTAIIDYNHLVITGPTEGALNLEPFRAKWQAFGWHVQEVDGHDVEALCRAFASARALETAPGRPRLIIAHTTKGKGVSYMEGDRDWHAGHLKEDLYQRALAELGEDGRNENGR